MSLYRPSHKSYLEFTSNSVDLQRLASHSMQFFWDKNAMQTYGIYIHIVVVIFIYIGIYDLFYDATFQSKLHVHKWTQLHIDSEIISDSLNLHSILGN